MEELFQTYTESGEPLDLVPRSIVHRKGLWHRSVNVFLFNSDGNVLLQHRVADKDICPNAWDLSVGEHLIPGEDDMTGAVRGLDEELSIAPSHIETWAGPLSSRLEDATLGIKDFEIQQCFRAQSDQEIHFNTAEVDAVRFVSLSDLEIEMAEHPERFTPWLHQMADHVGLFN